MLKKTVFTIMAVMTAAGCYAQSDASLPYYQIPDAPAEYTAGAVAARMVDGLGFRYYWATEGLRVEDLAFRPSEEARTSLETIQHIKGLTDVLVNAIRQKPNEGGVPPSDDLAELRKATLANIKEAADKLRTSSPEDLAAYDMIFKTGNGDVVYPFWNHLNGPIADALWHVGQVVTFRRSSGNPLPKGVNVLEGKKG